MSFILGYTAKIPKGSPKIHKEKEVAPYGEEHKAAPEVGFDIALCSRAIAQS